MQIPRTWLMDPDEEWMLNTRTALAKRGCHARFAIKPFYLRSASKHTHTHTHIRCVYGLVSLRLHCFLRLARALCWRSGRCLVGAAFSV